MISMNFSTFYSVYLFGYFFCIPLNATSSLIAAVPVAPFDGAGVDIVASLHLADGIVVSCFVLVSLGFALKR